MTSKVLAAAVALGKARQRPRASKLAYDDASNKLRLEFSDASEFGVAIQSIPELAALTKSELKSLRLAGRGTFVRQDEKDLDISIEGIIAATPFVSVTATRVAAIRHGSVTSAAKARAARENGTRGGRPAAR